MPANLNATNYVTRTGTAGAGTTAVLTNNSNAVPAGSLVVVHVAKDGTAVPTSVVDSAGNVYAEAVHENSAKYMGVWWCVITTAIPATTGTWTATFASTTNRYIDVRWVVNPGTVTVLDQSSSGSGTGTTGVNAPVLLPAFKDSFVDLFTVGAGTTGTFTATNGFTVDASVTVVGTNIVSAQKILSGSGLTAGGGTWSVSQAWRQLQVVFTLGSPNRMDSLGSVINTSPASHVLTISRPVPVGALISVQVQGFNSSGNTGNQVTSVTDTAGNTYTKDNGVVAGLSTPNDVQTWRAVVAVGKALAAGDTITAGRGTAEAGRISGLRIMGPTGGTLLDTTASGTNTGTNATAVVAPSVTHSVASGLAAAVMLIGSQYSTGTPAYAPAGGWNEQFDSVITGTQWGEFQWAFINGTFATRGSATESGATTSFWAAVASFYNLARLSEVTGLLEEESVVGSAATTKTETFQAATAGDLLILHAATNESAGADAITTPTGYTLIAQSRNGTTNVNANLYAKIAVGGETSVVVTAAAAQRLQTSFQNAGQGYTLTGVTTNTANTASLVLAGDTGSLTPSATGGLIVAQVTAKNRVVLDELGDLTPAVVTNETTAGSTAMLQMGVWYQQNATNGQAYREQATWLTQTAAYSGIIAWFPAAVANVTDAGTTTGVIVAGGLEAIADAGTTTLVGVTGGTEAVADVGTTTSALASGGTEAIGDAATTTLVIVSSGVTVSQADAGTSTIVGVSSGSEAICDQSPNMLATTAGGASTPDQAALASGTATIDLRVRLATPLWIGAAMGLLSQFNALVGGTSIRWVLEKGSNGSLLGAFVNQAGSTQQSSVSAAVPFLPNEVGWVRTLIDPVAHTIAVYWSRDDVTYTQLGTTTNVVSTALRSGASAVPLTAGGDDVGAATLTGALYAARVLIGGVPVIDMDFTTASGAGPWTSPKTGEVWTAVNTAAIAKAPIGALVTTGAEAKADLATTTLVIASSGADAIADAAGLVTIVGVSGGTEAVGDAGTCTIVITQPVTSTPDAGTSTAVVVSSGTEALADAASSTGVLVSSGTEAIADASLTGIAILSAGTNPIPPDSGTGVIVGVTTGTEAIADTATSTAVLVVSGVEHLADSATTTGVIVSTGTNPIPPDSATTTIIVTASGTEAIADAATTTFACTSAGIEKLADASTTTIVVAVSGVEKITDTGLLILTLVAGGADAISDQGSTTFVLSNSPGDALADAGSCIYAISGSGTEAIADAGSQPAVLVSGGVNEQLADASTCVIQIQTDTTQQADAGVVLITIVVTEVDAEADAGSSPVVLVPGGAETLADAKTQLLGITVSGADGVGDAGTQPGVIVTSGTEAVADAGTTTLQIALNGLVSLTDTAPAVIVVVSGSTAEALTDTGLVIITGTAGGADAIGDVRSTQYAVLSTGAEAIGDAGTTTFAVTAGTDTGDLGTTTLGVSSGGVEAVADAAATIIVISPSSSGAIADAAGALVLVLASSGTEAIADVSPIAPAGYGPVGFETGTLEGFTALGTAAVSSADAHTGSESVVFDASTALNYLRRVTGGSVPYGVKANLDFWVKLPANPAVLLALGWLENTVFGTAATVRVTTAGKIVAYDTTGGVQEIVGPTLTLGKWTHIVLSAVLQASGTGTIGLVVDGVDFGTVIAPTGTSLINNTRIGQTGSGLSPAITAAYLDDLAFYTDAAIHIFSGAQDPADASSSSAQIVAQGIEAIADAGTATVALISGAPGQDIGTVALTVVPGGAESIADRATCSFVLLSGQVNEQLADKGSSSVTVTPLGADAFTDDGSCTLALSSGATDGTGDYGTTEFTVFGIDGTLQIHEGTTSFTILAGGYRSSGSQPHEFGPQVNGLESSPLVSTLEGSASAGGLNGGPETTGLESNPETSGLTIA